MEPLSLNELYVLDGLVYGLQIDTMSQSAVLTIQIDSDFNKGVCETVGLEAPGAVLLDFVFSGVTSAVIERMLPRKGQTAPDEPPHSYEISTWKVDRRFFRNDYQLRIHTYWGPRSSIVFKGVDVIKSSRPPGVVHDYEAEASDRKKEPDSS